MSRRRRSTTYDTARGRTIGDLEKTLERLAGILHDLGSEGDAMTPGEMDGFVAGSLVVSEHVPPSEWLAVVLGWDTEFESIEAAEATDEVYWIAWVRGF